MMSSTFEFKLKEDEDHVYTYKTKRNIGLYAIQRYTNPSLVVVIYFYIQTSYNGT